MQQKGGRELEKTSSGEDELQERENTEQERASGGVTRFRKRVARGRR
jgi:hypothetical protein